MSRLLDKLYKLRDDAGQGRSLPMEELRFIESCLTATDAEDRAIACEIIFRVPNAEEVRGRALDELELLCEAANNEDYAASLLTTLLFIASGEITRKVKIRDFAFRSSISTRWQIRTNAVLALERLAHNGDRAAVLRIEELAGDSEAHVRGNARNSLGRLK